MMIRGNGIPRPKTGNMNNSNNSNEGVGIGNNKISNTISSIPRPKTGNMNNSNTSSDGQNSAKKGSNTFSNGIKNKYSFGQNKNKNNINQIYSNI